MFSNSECLISKIDMLEEEEDETDKNLSSDSGNTLTISEEINAQKLILSNPSGDSIDSMLFSSMNSEKIDSNSIIVYDDSNYYSKSRKSCSTFKSVTELDNDEDPLLACSIGLKCFTFKPVGYIFLTRFLNIFFLFLDINK
jgi:hypothetical protein